MIRGCSLKTSDSFYGYLTKHLVVIKCISVTISTQSLIVFVAGCALIFIFKIDCATTLLIIVARIHKSYNGNWKQEMRKIKINLKCSTAVIRESIYWFNSINYSGQTRFSFVVACNMQNTHIYSSEEKKNLFRLKLLHVPYNMCHFIWLRQYIMYKCHYAYTYSSPICLIVFIYAPVFTYHRTSVIPAKSHCFPVATIFS